MKYIPLKNAFKQLLITIFLQMYFINNSCNFILYLLTGPSFRKELIEMFTFCKKQNSTTATTTMMKSGEKNHSGSSIITSVAFSKKSLSN